MYYLKIFFCFEHIDIESTGSVEILKLQWISFLVSENFLKIPKGVVFVLCDITHYKISRLIVWAILISVWFDPILFDSGA